MAQSIHFLGIGGVGMAGLAFLLKKRGQDISGCDKYASPRTDWLVRNDISVEIGHSPSHLEAVDELVITPAVPPDNPELAAARAAGLTVRSRGEVLASLVNETDGIAVCGTHGKTTTATFTTRLLQNLGAHPSWCIGGETGSVPVAGVGTGPIVSGTGPTISGTGPLVVEADESDGTLALYHPHTLVLNAVDFDHLEHFSSKEDYFDCYRAVIRQTSDAIIVCADHPQALALVEGVCPHEAAGRRFPQFVTFGFSPKAQVNAADWPDIPVLGRHNVANALAAIAVALSRGFTREQIAAALPDAVSALPDRRFELVAESDGVRVYTDYAHHPAELKCAIDMAHALHPTRLRVLFQPHRYSRTKALRDEFPPAFATADEVVLAPVYAAFEKPIPGGDITDLYAAFGEQTPHAGDGGLSPHVILARSIDEGWQHLIRTARPGDILMLLGAGDIINLVPHVQAELAKRARRGIAAFLINLDRHPDRLATAQKRLLQAGVEVMRMPAVDGSALSSSERRAAVSRFHALLAHGCLYTPGQIGCALSHHAVYRRMIEEKLPAALVFEDDILLAPGFPASLAAAETLLNTNRAQVFLFSDGTFPPLPSDGNAFTRTKDGDCAEAYLLTLPAARELLRVNSPMVVPFDSWSRFTARGHIELYRATPATATQDHTFQSVVPINGRPANGFLRFFWNLARLVELPLDALWFRLTGK